MKRTIAIKELVIAAKNCTHCQSQLPHPVNPVFMWPTKPKIIIISQAPGRLADNASTPWLDPSGDRLRHWLNIDKETFYESGLIAAMPMSFCFPGYKNGADAPPLKPCAPLWHEKFLATVTQPFVIIIGRYAQHYYTNEYNNLSHAVEKFEELLPDRIVLPHPSGRNNRWFTKHPWFEIALLPKLRARVEAQLAD